MRTSHRIACGRAVLAAESAGSGTAIVFVHANVADRRMWEAQMQALGRSHHAVSYDRRGFGETHAEPEDFSAVADLVAVIDALADSKPAIVVGCSQGGKIALDLALQHPAHVSALALIAPTITGAPEAIYPAGTSGLLARLKQAEAAGDPDLIAAIKAHLWLDGPLQQEGRVTGQPRQLFFDMNAIALRSPPTGSSRDTAPAFHRLHEIGVPTLVLCGDDDFPHIQERSRQAATMLPQASFHLVTGAAHLPSLDQPDLVTAHLLAFVRHHTGVQ